MDFAGSDGEDRGQGGGVHHTTETGFSAAEVRLGCTLHLLYLYLVALIVSLCIFDRKHAVYLYRAQIQQEQHAAD